MKDMLFNGVGWTDIALTLNRIAVGMFFMVSGYHKLFNAQRHRTLADELKELGIHAVGSRPDRRLALCARDPLCIHVDYGRLGRSRANSLDALILGLIDKRGA
jgi:uncharacterized membrane protein YphA (DoxX/SURF4 family)